MISRTAPDLRAEAHRAIARRLHREGCLVPTLLATELLAILDGHHIGLTDTRPANNPDADWHPPTDPTEPTAPTPGAADYRAARQALKGQQ